MALLLADINRAPEFRAFLDKINDFCKEVESKMLKSNSIKEHVSYTTFYKELFKEVDELKLENIVTQLPNSLLNEILFANALLDRARIRLQKAFEIAEIVLSSIVDMAAEIYKPLITLLKELVQLSSKLDLSQQKNTKK